MKDKNKILTITSWGFFNFKPMVTALYERIKGKLDLINTDSRTLKPGQIFWALRGDRFDGNSYVESALNQDPYLVVTELNSSDKRVFTVDDGLQALQQLSQLHRKTLGTRILALTGSNGKTTTKELLYHILKNQFNVLATKGNLNNHIGVPLTLLQLKAEHELAIVEMGANHPREIDQLSNITDPDYGLITNIGKAHLEGMGSLEGVLNTKTELFDFLEKKNGLCFYNFNSELLLKKKIKYTNIISYGDEHSEAVNKYKIIKDHPSLELEDLNSGHIYRSSLFGKHNGENLMAAITIGKYFGLDTFQIADGLSSYIPMNMRSQILQYQGNHIVLDAYNANPSSMSMAIQSFATIDSEDKWVIIGGMAELGEYSENEHRQLVDFILLQKFQKVILVGEDFKWSSENKNIMWFQDVHQCKSWFKNNLPSNKHILIKGSRSIGLEKLVID